MSRRRRYRSSGGGSGSPWWISGVYAVGLAVALFVILSVTGNSDSPGFMHQMFFGSTSESSDASDSSSNNQVAPPSGTPVQRPTATEDSGTELPAESGEAADASSNSETTDVGSTGTAPTEQSDAPPAAEAREPSTEEPPPSVGTGRD